MNKTLYLISIIEKVRKELHITSTEYSFEECEVGNKMTLDGINYFNEILSVKIYFKGTLIGKYNIEKKILHHYMVKPNLELAEKVCELVNNFVGYDKIKPNYKKLYEFENYKENLDEGLSEEEMWFMFEHKI